MDAEMAVESGWPTGARCDACAQVIHPPTGVLVQFTDTDRFTMHRACLLTRGVPEAWHPYLKRRGGPLFACFDNGNVTFLQSTVRWCEGCGVPLRTRAFVTVIVMNEGEDDEEELWFCTNACRDAAVHRGTLIGGEPFGIVAIEKGGA
jgi:hypothetical protein